MDELFRLVWNHNKMISDADIMSTYASDDLFMSLNYDSAILCNSACTSEKTGRGKWKDAFSFVFIEMLWRMMLITATSNKLYGINNWPRFCWFVSLMTLMLLLSILPWKGRWYTQVLCQNTTHFHQAKMDGHTMVPHDLLFDLTLDKV